MPDEAISSTGTTPAARQTGLNSRGKKSLYFRLRPVSGTEEVVLERRGNLSSNPSQSKRLPVESGLLPQLRSSSTDHSAGSLETLNLEVSWLSDSVFEQFATKLGSLTTLLIRSNNGIKPRKLEAISHNCKRLVSLSWVDNISLSLMWKKQSHVEVEDEPLMRILPNLKHLSLHFALLTNSSVFGVLSGCPGLECVEIQGGSDLTLDPSVVKEKFPNIVTLDIGNGAKPRHLSAFYGDCNEEYSDSLTKNELV